MAYNKADATALALVQLGDTGSIWSAANVLYNFVDTVVNEISQKEPKKNKTYLTVVDGTKYVDLSGLTYLICVFGERVECPAGKDIPSWVNFRWVTPTKIELDRSSDPDVSETTLTGTLTFTAADATVTGSATAVFLTEVSEGDFIKRSTDSRYYKVASVTDDTHLELEENYAGTTGADTADKTVIAENTGIVAVYWGGNYTVSSTATDMPTKFDELLVKGIVAYALQREAIKKAPTVNVAAGVTNAYTSIADRRFADYQRDLFKIGIIDDWTVANYPKE